jgi:spermidine synthase
MTSRAPARLVIPVLFVLSGATGLVYEVAWTKMLSLVFGSTALAVSSVLAAFMAGLALGSRFFGARADRTRDELRVYGLLEIGVAASALLLLPALDVVERAVVGIWRTFHPSFGAMSLVRFGFSFVLLLVPTAFMGGTLPVLVRFWTRTRDDVGRSLGRLYAINTLGAMAGCFAAGFWLIEAFGVRRTVLLAAAANVAIGLVALALSRGASREAEAEAEAEASPAVRGVDDGAPAGPALLLAAIGLSGFLALGYEVVWTRVLLYVLSTSVHAFTVMLTTFLAGLGLGSLALSGRIARVSRGLVLLGVVEIAIGAAALGTIALLSRYPDVHDALLVLFRVRSWNELTMVKLVEAGLVVLVPTFLMGTTFPLVAQLYARDPARLGRRVGGMVAVNTAGAVLGSFAAGFLLIPAIGTQRTIVLLAVANGVLGGVLLAAGAASPARRAAAFLPALMLLALSFTMPPNAFLPVFGNNLRGAAIVYVREGISGTVTIHDAPGSRLLSINGVDVAGTSFALRTTQKLQAHIPLLLHPDPRAVLQVGLGSGETAHSILLHPIERLVGCDLSPEVIEAGPYFSEINRAAYSDPRLHIVIEDAKNYVTSTEETFDLILNDSVHPIYRGSSDLYARDYFAACRARLRDGGMMSSWFPTGLLSEADLLMILRTFRDVFPKSTVWIATNAVTRNALMLGWKEGGELRIDYRELARRLRRNRALRADLAEVNLGMPDALLDAFMLGPGALERLTEGARINTYDRPWLEFTAPRVIALADRMLWARNFAAITGNREPLLPYLVHLAETPEGEARTRRRLERRRDASQHVIRGLTLDLADRALEAQAAYGEALAALPGDPIASTLVEQGKRVREALEARAAAGEAGADDALSLARMRSEEGDVAGAAEVLREAAAKYPDRARVQLELGVALRRLGELAQARAAAEAALRLDSRLVAGWAILGAIRAEEGDEAGALRDLTRASEEGAALPWAELMLGKLLRKRGDAEAARARFEEAIDLAPDSPAAEEARRLLGGDG